MTIVPTSPSSAIFRRKRKNVPVSADHSQSRDSVSLGLAGEWFDARVCLKIHAQTTV